MHGFHNREDNAPVSFPCGCSINSCRFFKSQRDILQIAGIQQQVHRHIEYGVQKDNTYSVCQSHLGSQLYNRHHQDSKRYEHTAYNVQIDEAVCFAVSHASSDGVAGQGMDDHSQDNGDHSDQYTVCQGIPEVGNFHSFCKVAEAPGAWERQGSCNIVGHFRRLLKSNDDSHIQREEDG